MIQEQFDPSDPQYQPPSEEEQRVRGEQLKQIVTDYQLAGKEHVLFLRAVAELSGMGTDEDWGEIQTRLKDYPKVKEALTAYQSVVYTLLMSRHNSSRGGEGES